MSSRVVNKITFDFETMEFKGITKKDVMFWESCFPKVDVIDVLERKIPVWLSANPSKACKYKNFKRFIVNWLGAAEDKYKRYEKTS